MLRSSSMQREAQILYRVPRSRRGWELSEEKMPESTLHDEAVELLKAILAFWARGRENVRIARNLAVRWDEEEPRIGLDPDVGVFSPAPPPEPNLRSVRTWLPGHFAPMLAIEVVSDTHPRKDYVTAPDKYAASGTGELVIFDPLLAGPSSHGGPYLLQLWRHDDTGRFVRVHAGEGPAYSETLGAFVAPFRDAGKLRIADDAGGARLWPTGEEAERAAKEEALARVAALEAALKAK
jgi:hypothetical protein